MAKGYIQAEPLPRSALAWAAQLSDCWLVKNFHHARTKCPIRVNMYSSAGKISSTNR